MLEESLNFFNFSEYEIKSFLALYILGAGTAEQIAEFSGIPRTSAYKALEKLLKKGLIRKRSGRPRIYVSISLEELREIAIKKIDEIIEEIRDLQNQYGRMGEPQVVFTLWGKDKVLKKIGEFVDIAEKEIVLSTPHFEEIYKDIQKCIDRALKRGVEILLIIPPKTKVPKGFKVYRKDGLIATDLLVDGKYALLASANLDACGYTDNERLVEHLRNFIELMLS